MEIVNDGWPVAVNPITERNPSRPYCISQRVCLNISAILKVWGLVSTDTTIAMVIYFT
jgi:hypothetical protein